MASAEQDSALELLQLLDVEESAADERLRELMARRTFEPRQLRRARALLRYKLLVNAQDGAGTDSRAELAFAARLLPLAARDTLPLVCDILRAALLLGEGAGGSGLRAPAEHLLQQLLAELAEHSPGEPTPLLRLKMLDTVLDAAMTARVKLFLVLNDVPIENVVYSDDAETRYHFLLSTCVKLIAVVEGLHILDKIWNLIRRCDDKNTNLALSAICSLSQYYLPMSDAGPIQFESVIINDGGFWLMILKAIKSDNIQSRKYSLYLAKRAVDYILSSKKWRKLPFIDQAGSIPVNIQNWTQHEEKFEETWKSFFVLLETLEEKQSNIVLAALPFFNKIDPLGEQWCSCAFELALKHENQAVVQKALQYRLQSKVANVAEAHTILQAFNNISLCDSSHESLELWKLMTNFCSDVNNFKTILKAFNGIKWSPVPLFYMTEMFTNLDMKNILNDEEILYIFEILKRPCNNIVLREAVHYNVFYFVTKKCYHKTHNFLTIVDQFRACIADSTKWSQEMALWVQNNIEIPDKNLIEMWKEITESHSRIDVALIYLESEPDHIQHYLTMLVGFASKIKDVNSRQYAPKDDCDWEFTYICTLITKIKSYNHNSIVDTLHAFTMTNLECLLVYILNLMGASDTLNMDKINVYLKQSECIFLLALSSNKHLNLMEEIIKAAQHSITDNQCEEIPVQKYFSMKLLATMFRICAKDKYGILRILEKISLLDNIYLLSTSEEKNMIKMRKILCEASCEFIVYAMAHDNFEEVHLEKILLFLEEMLDSGSYGCLLWILRIFKGVLPYICGDKTKVMLVPPFLNRLWKEVEELKSNDQYKPCIKEFVAILLHSDILELDNQSNLVLSYCTKIIQQGSVSNIPLYFIADVMYKKKSCFYSLPFIMILSEIIMFGGTPLKDKRITDATVKYIQKSVMYSAIDFPIDIYHFDSEIRNKAMMSLFKISSPGFIIAVMSRLMMKIHELFRNKQRYHGNSEPHRMLLRAVQSMLLALLLSPGEVDMDETVHWCVNMLGKLPHQPSVRISLEWYIGLYVIIKNLDWNRASHLLKLDTIPQISLFMIMFLVMKQRLKKDINSILSEFTSVMDSLLSHTMGQLFNIRLYAQYLSLLLFEIASSKSSIISQKYQTTCEIIKNTFKESGSEKSFIKLKNDYFINEFDLVENLTPRCIYYFLPKYTSVGYDEIMEYDLIPSTDDCIDFINNSSPTNIKLCSYWINAKKKELTINELPEDENFKEEECNNAIGTIQKKYIPWSNMLNGAEFSAVTQQRVNTSGLIVVASLIDKLPNLGGLARTSEVFGVKKYIIDSIRHMHDKQFQGLSVSAERWVDIEEVRPGAPLKEYLQRMKCEGYTIVAAEQTCSSVSLTKFKFPHKTVLLLGHEKEGVPCDLLPLMDHCVEIPQRGYVRSLNVHVTAAIFVWEYVRQSPVN